MSNRYGPRIVTDGLVLCLDAADNNSYPGSGTTWTDLSGNGNNGTLNNGPTFSSANRGSIVFDGTNDWISVTRNSSLSPTSAITEEAMIFRTSTSDQVFIGLQYGSSTENSYALWYEGGAVRVLIRNSSGMVIVTYTVTLSLNTWYHLIHTYDGTNQKIYINGELKQTTATTGSIVYDANNTVITLGADNNLGYNTGQVAYMNGRISMVKIYNRALSASEVLQNYNAIKGRFGL